MLMKKTKQRITAMLLSVIMLLGMMPVATATEAGSLPIGGGSEITAFEVLGSDIAVRSVPLGTSKMDLELPDNLTATIRFAASEDEPALDSGDADGGTVASPSDAEKSGDGTEELTVPLPMTWASSPEYDGEAAGSYLFTPELPEGLILASGVNAPTITVTVSAPETTATVDATTITGSVTDFDALPDYIRWQNTTTPDFPETVDGTVEGDAAEIPVTWKADHDYDAEAPQRGLYVFTAVLGEGYALADGVELPRITVYIPQRVGGKMSRMAGSGTTDSPLEITTAAQLAEIATLVNARPNGLELFLFNDANAPVTLKLQNDIDLSSYGVYWNDAKGWIPIGTESHPFKGSFDGNGCRITGLYIQNASLDYAGLFGSVWGAVKNLGLTDVMISGRNYVGGIAGGVQHSFSSWSGSDRVKGSYVIGSVSGNDYVGGLVGQVQIFAKVQDSYFRGSVSGNDYVGGILGGSVYGSSHVMGSYAAGTVSGKDYVGGIVGQFGDFSSGVFGCYATNAISGQRRVGGIVGGLLTPGSTVWSVAALNPYVSGTEHVGRIMGYADGTVFTGNIALSTMYDPGEGKFERTYDRSEMQGGASVTPDEFLSSENFFEFIDGGTDPWEYAAGKLPLLAGLADQNSDLPPHLLRDVTSPFAGAGTSGSPYLIQNPSQLARLAELVNTGDPTAQSRYNTNEVHYKLMDDLDLSAYASGEGWVPIGTSSTTFKGHFDGGNHKITGLTINRPTVNYQGLFGHVTGGTVKNLGATGVNINGGSYVGGVAGYVESSGTVQNCYSTGSVTGTVYVGGVAGDVTGGSMVQNCYSIGSVSGDRYVGGVAGVVAGGSMVQNSYNTGIVSGYESAGGVAGIVTGGRVENCYSTGSVTGSDPVGGVAGRVVNSGRVQNCATLNPGVTATASIPSVGRVAGYIYDSTLAGNIAFSGMTVTQGGSTKTPIEGANQVDGLSKSAAEIAAPSFWTTASGFTENWDTAIWTIEPGRLPILKGIAGQDAPMPAHLLPAGAVPFEGGGTSESDPYLIQTAGELARLAAMVNAGNNFSGRYFELKNDLDLSGYASGEGWESIGKSGAPFRGVFYGKGHSVTGLYINRPAAQYQGLFGYVGNGGLIDGIGIKDGTIYGGDYVGGVAGYLTDGVIRNSYSVGAVSGNCYMGGIAGGIADGTVERCYAAGNVVGTSFSGGIAGIITDTTIQNCYATGDVNASMPSFVGGIAANISGNSIIQYCYATGVLKSYSEVGGIWGAFSDTAGTLCNNVALSPSITQILGVPMARVGGTYHGMEGRRSNYAFAGMIGGGEYRTLDGADGADVTSQTLFGGDFWTNPSYWADDVWDLDIWQFTGNKLPTLKGVGGPQTGDGGLYLTARDIRHATVTPNESGLIYNGGEQIPALTVTFGGETLIKGIDYAVTVADASASNGIIAGQVTLSLTGIGNFTQTKTFAYTIAKKAIAVAPGSGQSKIYGAADPALTYMPSEALIAGNFFTGALARNAGENVGTYAITLGTLSAGGNYTLSLASGTVNFSIEQAKVQSIDTAVSDVTMSAYEARSAADKDAVIALANLPASVSVTTDGGTAALPITWNTTTAYNSKGASYAVTSTFTGNGNINFNGVTAGLTVTVTPVTAVNPTFSDTLVVTNSDSSATAAELGSTVLPASGSITVEGQSIAYIVNWNGSEMLNRTAVGNEQTFTGTVSYPAPPAWLTLPSDLSVSRKVMVTAKQLVAIGGITTANKTYDGAVYVPSGTITVTGGSVPVNQLEWLYESTDGKGYSSSAAPTNAGAYKLTISVPDSNANYAGNGVFPFTIAKREITLAADNKTIIKGNSLPALTYTVGNPAPDETVADAFSAAPTLACPTFNGNMPGSYAITLTGGTASGNYTIASRTNGTLTVAEQTYTISFNLSGGARTGGGELTQTVAEGGAATAPTVSRSGYTFTGWDKAFTNVTSDLTVTAVWSDNGDDGGSDGDSYTPNTPVTVTPEKKPDQPVTAAAPVTATAGTGGAASAAVSDKTITDAIAQAQAYAKAQGKTANGIAVELNITMPQGASSLSLILSQNALQSLVNAGVTSLSINGGIASLGLDLEALKEIQRQSTGDVTISFRPVTSLSAAAKKLIGKRPVFDVTVSYLKAGKLHPITSLGKGGAALSFPYSPGRNEAVGLLFGVYVDANGKAQRIPGSAYDANSGSLILNTNHFSIYGVAYTTPTEKYKDIANHWAKESIDYVVGRGLFSGTTEKTFSPNMAMDRGMLVTVLGRLAGADVSTYKTSSFSDVATGKYYLPYVEWAYKNGIISGIGGGKFAPERAVTREEIALILQNYAKATGYKLPVTREATAYADASSIGNNYAAAVTAMQQAGIMMGGTGNRFNPKASATRAEVSSMLHRYIKLAIDPDTAQGWALNDTGQWLYYKDGKVLTGTQTIDGVRYFFETNGTLKTGWVKDGDNWRYYSGNKAAMGWLDISDKRYYFTKDGLMVSGKWLQIDGKWYYFYADGALAKSTKVDGYEVNENGVRKSK